MAEFIAYSRTVPQKMNYASAGIGSVSHLAAEVIKDGAGMDIVHVPYKGGGPAMNDVVAGHVAAQHGGDPGRQGSGRDRQDQGPGGHQHRRARRCCRTSRRLQEAGVKTADVDLRFWFGIFGPKGIPDAVKAKLDKAVAATMAHPRVRERLAKLDIEPDYAPGPRAQVKLENEIKNWTEFIDAKGIKPE